MHGRWGVHREVHRSGLHSVNCSPHKHERLKRPSDVHSEYWFNKFSEPSSSAASPLAVVQWNAGWPVQFFATSISSITIFVSDSRKQTITKLIPGTETIPVSPTSTPHHCALVY